MGHCGYIEEVALFIYIYFFFEDIIVETGNRVRGLETNIIIGKTFSCVNVIELRTYMYVSME